MRVTALLCALLAATSIMPAQTHSVTDAEVKRVHSSTLLIDTHNDITSRIVEGYDIGKNKNDGHTNVTSLRAGGVGAEFFAVYVAPSYVTGSRSAHHTRWSPSSRTQRKPSASNTRPRAL